MKRGILIFTSLMSLFLFVNFVNALPDLVIEDISFDGNSNLVSGFEYNVTIKNIGDESVNTSLIIDFVLYGQGVSEGLVSVRKIDLLDGLGRFVENGTKDGAKIYSEVFEKMKVVEENGEERFETPEIGKTYSLFSSEEEFKEQMEEYEKRKREFYSSEVPEEVILKDIERHKAWLLAGKEFYVPKIAINPGEKIIWSSEDTDPYRPYLSYMSIPYNPNVSSLETKFLLKARLNDGEREFEKSYVIGGKLIRGPYTKKTRINRSDIIPTLESNREYFLSKGCTNEINNKEICIEELEMQEGISIHVEDKTMILERYNPLIRWIIILLLEGKESPDIEFEDIKFSLYPYGVKIRLE